MIPCRAPRPGELLCISDSRSPRRRLRRRRRRAATAAARARARPPGIRGRRPAAARPRHPDHRLPGRRQGARRRRPVLRWLPSARTLCSTSMSSLCDGLPALTDHLQPHPSPPDHPRPPHPHRAARPPHRRHPERVWRRGRHRACLCARRGRRHGGCAAVGGAGQRVPLLQRQGRVSAGACVCLAGGGRGAVGCI